MASIVTALLTQILQLWLYQDVIAINLKRKMKMLKKNMLGIDKDQVPLYKIKLKVAFCKIKFFTMILPKHLRKYQGIKLIK